jgi:Ca2+-binding RTX toxin-like protein
MRWHKHLLIATAVLIAAAATATAAFGASAPPGKRAMQAHPADKAKAKKDKIKAKVQKDTLTVSGSSDGETIALRLRSGDPSILEVEVDGAAPAEFSFKRDKFDKIDVDAGGGDDVVKIDEANGAFTDTEATTLDGDAGNDTLLGGSLKEVLAGGEGNDFADGNRGDDVGLLGAGDDTFQWDPGDGSDVVEGQDGRDTMVFNGANIAEQFDVSANGPRVRFFRNVGNITMDLDDVETVDLRALGGADRLTVHDLAGTDLVELDGDLAGALGGTSSDGSQDAVVVEGTAGSDSIQAVGPAGNTEVAGLQALVRITHAEATDSLAIDARSGDDTVNAATLPADAVKLTADGGAGNDRLLGGGGADTLIGGDGNDFADGNRGDDVGLMGAGDDTFQWDPGDGSDTIEGQDGTDTMLFNGANIAEQFDLSANGPRLRFFRNIASITMDTNDVEVVDLRALGGADTVAVHDLSGTDVTSVRTDLAAAAGGGDGQPDQVTVDGTAGDDAIFVSGAAGSATVAGLSAQVAIVGAEPANDTLTIDPLVGDDVVEASALAADAIKLTADGGDGDDVLIGGAGADTLLGSAGDDVLIGGPGLDSLDGGPGSNVVIQD